MLIEDSPPSVVPPTHKPTNSEHRLGLWLDRLGQCWDLRKKPGLRLLGLYAVVDVLEGEGLFYSARSGWHRVLAGSGFWLHPHVPHFYQSVQRWHTRWIVFGGPLASAFHEIGNLNPDDPLIQGCHDIISDAFRTLRYGHSSRSDTEAIVNFASLSNVVARLHQSRPSDNNHVADLVAAIQRYIRENCAWSIAPQEIAHVFHISYSHMRRVFRDRTGSSVKRWITVERMTIARTLLQDTDRSLSEIAQAVGYEDYLYFLRVFKQFVGVPPGRYRRKIMMP